jgi:hypothetical protein
VNTSSVRKFISKITKRALRKGSRVAAPSLRYKDWLIKQLKNPAEAANLGLGLFVTAGKERQSHWVILRYHQKW